MAQLVFGVCEGRHEMPCENFIFGAEDKSDPHKITLSDGTEVKFEYHPCGGSIIYFDGNPVEVEARFTPLADKLVENWKEIYQKLHRIWKSRLVYYNKRARIVNDYAKIKERHIEAKNMFGGLCHLYYSNTGYNMPDWPGYNNINWVGVKN